MKNPKNSLKPTIVLNRNNSDGFLDMNSSSDLSEVMKVLKKLMEAGEIDER